jgi:hypothetical protein
VWTRVGGPKTEDRVEQWQGTIAIAHRSRCISSFLCCTTSEHTYLYTPWRGRDLVASAMHIIASLGEGKGKRCRPKLKIAGKTLWTCGYVDGRARCFRASQHLCIPLLAQSFQASLNLIQFFAPIPPSRSALHSRRSHVYIRPVLLQYHLRGTISGLHGL